MRIAFVTFEYPPSIHGGAGVYAENLVSGLAELDEEVTVYTPRYEGEAAIEGAQGGVEVRQLQTSKPGLIGLTRFCLHVIRELERMPRAERFDIVHLNTLGLFGFRDRSSGPIYVSTCHHILGETARKGGVRTVDRLLDVQGENGYIVPWFERYGAGFTDHYLAVSQETKEALRRLYHVPELAVDVIWNGVDPKGAPAGRQDREELRRRLGLPEGPLLLFIGRVYDVRKGLPMLMKAIASLGRRDVRLMVIGEGPSSKAEMLAKELGLDDRVTFKGKVSQEDLWASYMVADAHICASSQEGFGLTILEAICAGCPVITTDVGVVPELRDRLERVVPTGDHKAMAEAISSWLSSGEGRPRHAEISIPYDFSWKRCAKQVLAAYERAISLRSERRK